jgi:hypothetical protein
MSDGPVCSCPERKKPIEERNWVVVDRYCNYSAFNGYHRTYSDYSGLKCLSCGQPWRTKAAYVTKIRDPRGPIRWVQVDSSGGHYTDEPEDGQG